MASRLHDDDVLDILDSYAAKLGSLTRQTQRKLRGSATKEVQYVFMISDYLSQAVGHFLSGNLSALNTQVPVVVPACIAERVRVIAESMALQQQDVDQLKYPVHYAQKA